MPRNLAFLLLTLWAAWACTGTGDNARRKVPASSGNQGDQLGDAKPVAPDAEDGEGRDDAPEAPGDEDGEDGEPQDPAADDGPGGDADKPAPEFADADELWDAVEDMVSYGPRHTGSPAHDKFLKHLEAWMRRLGFQDIGRHTVTITGANLFTTPGAPVSGTSYHLHGILPGMSDEIVILGMHSDGQNSIEENGTIVAMKIAEYASRLPKSQRRRSLALVFPTAHMVDADSEEARGWAKANPEIVDKAVAVISPEHLGVVDPITRMPVDFQISVYTGKLRGKAEAIKQKLDLKRTSVSSFGLGSAMIFRQATGLPTVGGLALPLSYLFDPTKGMEVLEKRQLHQASLFFLEMWKHVDQASLADLRD